MNLAPPDDLPDVLRGRFERVAARLGEIRADLRAPLGEGAARVAVVSDFVLAVLEKHAEALAARLADPSPLAPSAVRAAADLEGASEAEAMAALRRIRQVETARIAWRDLCGAAAFRRSLEDLSALADGLIELALAAATRQLAPRFGVPTDSAGREAPMLVLAMGKLGGRELNFSSDVDLVFLHPDGAALEGRDAEETQDYFRRLAQLTIRLLDQSTADGFALRVDTRLRPFGKSGPLVVGLAAFEAYLLQHARDWERYAYVKARLVNAPEHESAIFDEILTPYVYRRYLDYGVFDALRDMKRLISREVERKEMADNIKLGPGGIREIEFIVQAFQLVRGGRDARLRTPSLLDALPRLAEQRALGHDAAAALAAAYEHLRTVENRLQAMDDRQTHTLPSDPEHRARLAYALGADGWDRFAADLASHRRAVETEFERIAWEPRAGLGEREGDAELRAAWESGNVAELLEPTPLAGDERVAALLGELRGGNLYRRMDETSRQRLAAVVIRTVPLLARHAGAAATLERVLKVFQSVCRRSAYLSLLQQNPAALERLVALASGSALVARQIAEHPLLLDELLDERLLEAPPTRAELEAMLDRQVAHADPADVESLLEAMRQFQRAAVFRVAIADKLGHLPIMRVSDRLTDIAELVLGLALETAWAEMVAKHGKPMYGEPPARAEAGFAVIGYGKLGGLELGYGSDLDLVFLHDSSGARQETDGEPPLDNTRFFSRLVQRLIHFLTIQTSSGKLYEVDTRLRPSGSAGLIVSSLDNFHRYQRHEAWVWEHQALLRSRSLAGAARVRAAFERERRDVLVNHVARDRLKDEIAKMRSRMRAELALGGRDAFDLKQDPGGIADIEFLVDYWVLAHAREHPELVDFPDNMRQLDGLAEARLVSAERCKRLQDIYLTLRRRIHELALDEKSRIVPADELVEERKYVTAVWDEVFG
ncbi:MAG TPA: bifunctional [glutamate--ammonia ligase]-adenylyl-L-tyrosine phosphorylase/[glutamate--ammonia-ligase] adenylyltransferase [Gammaproteobacteria bacterium]|nr:bifunctional [glutamate--ammonia ligase]-adenylyl-L-tyrosine phosphorylase/[glutamate--ammonia-ligase] adenylyltransferase [Gammaproteobacteria bacterium]